MHYIYLSWINQNANLSTESVLDVNLGTESVLDVNLGTESVLGANLGTESVLGQSVLIWVRNQCGVR
jgi:hypothetical protein